MNHLTQTRCHNHPDREAVARCPECQRFYCRECITEHDNQVLCATCLSQHKTIPPATGKRFKSLSGITQNVSNVLQITLGLLLTWGFFYYLGRILLTIPSSFHEGTVWKHLWD